MAREVELRRRRGQDHGSDYELLQQTRDSARSTRRIAGVSLALAASCLVSYLALREEPAEPFPEDMEEIKPGWAWTTVPALVRKGESMPRALIHGHRLLLRQSPQVGIVDKEMRVLVKELRGIRARISEPYVGWISCVSGKVQVVTRHTASETVKQVTKDMLYLQKGQRDTLKSLEKMKAKPLVPKLLGEANRTKGAARA